MFDYIFSFSGPWQVGISAFFFSLLAVIGWSFNGEQSFKSFVLHVVYSLVAGFGAGAILTLSPSLDLGRGSILGYSLLLSLVAKPFFKSILETASTVIPRISESLGKRFTSKHGGESKNDRSA